VLNARKSRKEISEAIRQRVTGLLNR